MHAIKHHFTHDLYCSGRPSWCHQVHLDPMQPGCSGWTPDQKQTSVHLTSQLRQHKKLIYLMSQSKFKGLHRQVNLRQFLPWFKLWTRNFTIHQASVRVKNSNLAFTKVIYIEEKEKYPLFVIIGYKSAPGWRSGVVEAIHSSRNSNRGWWSCWSTAAMTEIIEPRGYTFDSEGPVKSAGTTEVEVGTITTQN